MVIAVGEVWAVEEHTVSLTGIKDCALLIRDFNMIEIDQKALEAYFEPVEG